MTTLTRITGPLGDATIERIDRRIRITIPQGTMHVGHLSLALAVASAMVGGPTPAEQGWPIAA